MDILSEGCGHGQGVLRSQDHWAGATGDACGKVRVRSRAGLAHLATVPDREGAPQTVSHLCGEAGPIRGDGGGRGSQRGWAERPALEDKREWGCELPRAACRGSFWPFPNLESSAYVSPTRSPLLLVSGQDTFLDRGLLRVAAKTSLVGSAGVRESRIRTWPD